MKFLKDLIKQFKKTSKKLDMLISSPYLRDFCMVAQI